MAGDTFIRDKFAWLDQVAADAAVPAAHFKGAYAIVSRINRTTGDAWPSQRTLAATIRVNERTVRNIISTLVERGHLSVVVGKGPGQSNHYTMILEKRKLVAGIGEEEKRNVDSGIAPSNEESSCLFSETNTGNPLPQKRKLVAGKKRKPIAANTFEENPLKNPLNSRRAKKQRTPVPDNWPTADGRAWAQDFWSERGRQDLVERLDDEAEHCRDHHGKDDARFKDWGLVWKTWVRNALKFNKPDQRHATGAMSAVAGLWADYQEEPANG